MPRPEPLTTGAYHQPPSEPSSQWLECLPTAVATFSLTPPHPLIYRNARFVRLFGELADASPTLPTWVERAWPDPADRAAALAWWERTRKLIAAQDEEGQMPAAPWVSSITQPDGTILPVLISASRCHDQVAVTCVEAPPKGVEGPPIPAPDLERARNQDEQRDREQQQEQEPDHSDDRDRDREHDRQMCSLFENVPIGMFKSTPAGQFVYVNPALAAMLGFDSPAEAIATVNRTSIAEAIYADPSRRPGEVQEIERGIGTWKTFENRYRRRDGTPWTGILTFSEQPDPATGEPFLYGFVEDVTARRRQEEALLQARETAARQAGEQRLGALIEQGLAGVGETDLQGRVTRFNDRFRQLIGYDPEVLRGKTIQDITCPEDWAFEQAHLERLQRGEAIGIYEKRYRRQDGGIVHVQLAVTMLRDAQGEPTGFLALVTDLTALKETERRLRDSEQRYRALTADLEGQVAARTAELSTSSHYARSLLEASLDPLVTISADGKIMDVNRATEEATGVPRERLIGTDFSDYFTDPGQARAGYQRVFFQGRVKDYPLALRHASGRVMDVLYNASVYEDDGGRVAGIFAAARDVTQLKHSQQELERTNQEVLLLGQMTSLLQSCAVIDEAYPIIVATLERLFAGSSGRYYRLNAGGNLLEEVGVWGAPPSDTRAIIDPANCWALRRGHPHARGFGDSINPPCHYLGAGERPYICIPLEAQGTVLGIIHLLVDGADSQPERRERTQHLALAAADSISLALANLRLRESLHALSIRDPLTGLYNRRFMEESLERELSRMTRIDKPLAVAILDIDFFKPFNDNYGHDAGDAVLKEVAHLMLGFRLGSDVACRFGGEEFVLVLPELGIEQAAKRLDRFRLAVSQLAVQHRGQVLPTITVSIGVAVFPGHGRLGKDLLKLADTALYRAKQAGRNRVEIASTEAPVTMAVPET